MPRSHLDAPSAAPAGYDDDVVLMGALRRGDEDAFAWLVRRHHDALLRFAGLYVRDRAVAEEVVQETWLGVIRGIGSFEGRSTLKTWIFHILANRARTRGERESRSVPFSALVAREFEDDEALVDPGRPGTAPSDPRTSRRSPPPWATAN